MRRTTSRTSSPLIAVVVAAVLFSALAPRKASAAVCFAKQTIHVGTDEVIDGTLIANGETVLIDGTIRGDLLVFARSTKIRGDVEGSVYVFTQSLDHEGVVDQNFHAFAQWSRINGIIGGNLYVFTQQLHLLPEASVERDVFFMSEGASIEGIVERDLMGFVAALDLLGEVGREVSIAAERVIVSAGARVGGDLVAELPDEADLSMQEGALVEGEIKRKVVKRKTVQARSEYLTLEFYLWKVLFLSMAFLTGMVLFLVLPGLFRTEDASLGMAFGFGLLLLLAVPLVCVLLLVTVVGIPLSLLLLVLYLAAFYLAKILAAGWLGSSILGKGPDDGLRFALALLVGLVILAVATNLPWVGWIVQIAVLGLGMGLVFQRLRAWRAGAAESRTAPATA